MAHVALSYLWLRFPKHEHSLPRPSLLKGKWPFNSTGASTLRAAPFWHCCAVSGSWTWYKCIPYFTIKDHPTTNIQLNIMSSAQWSSEDFNQSRFHYKPTKWVGFVFVALFLLTTAVHVYQAIRYRLWFRTLLTSTVLCGVFEVVGWSGRLWASLSNDPSKIAPFIMGNTTTLVGPARLMTANFDILGIIISQLGPRYARLSGTRYQAIFRILGLAPIILEIVGSITSYSNNQSLKSSHIALAGIIVQIVGAVAFMAVGYDFFSRHKGHKSLLSPRDQEEAARGVVAVPLKRMFIGMFLSSALILVRCIFRAIELGQGWKGSFATTEWLFVVFDAVLILLAMFTLNIFHPGTVLGDPNSVGVSLDYEMDGTGQGLASGNHIQRVQVPPSNWRE
ncbi:RTA1 like protein-domain-containing protein [Gloeopeniophorella convolvens]|nr:RTA1 like protein-domain-containing protein [Gloeopeniophorella convolvens]